MVNTAKLKGRITEKGYNLSSFSEAVGISRPALRSKMNNITEFRVSEIGVIRNCLEIAPAELDSYFFCE